MSAQSVLERQGNALEEFVGAHLRRNFVALSLDFGAYGLGLTFASSTTVLPAFAEHLGASNLFIGAIPAMFTMGFALPQLFFANHAEGLSRKMRFILTVTVWERVPLLFLAVATFLLAERWPSLMLLMLLLCVLTMTSVGGSLMPAWLDLVAKVIPMRYRGRLFAFGSTFSAGLGLAGAALIGYYLQNFRFPLNYALCFGTGFACYVVSFVFLAFTTEPEVASTKPKIGLGSYLGRLPAILKRNHNFAWYLGHRALGLLGMMANGFYAVFALRTLGSPEWQVAQFTLILLACQTVATFIFGFVADRLGYRVVLLVGWASLMLGNGIALASTRTEHVYVVFLCLGLFSGALNVSSMNISLEFGPVEDRPTYVGLNNTLLAPLAILSSLAGGLLADRAGYRAVFVVAGLATALSVAILASRVRDPRRVAQPVVVEVSL